MSSQHVSSPDVKNDAVPKWASNSQRVFLMGRSIYALTGRAARHENKFFVGGNTFQKNPLWEFLLPTNRAN